jgi:hypothetical protein
MTRTQIVEEGATGVERYPIPTQFLKTFMLDSAARSNEKIWLASQTTQRMKGHAGHRRNFLFDPGL